MLSFSKTIEIIEGSAKTRGDAKIPREFIEKALNRVNSREEKVELYLSGTPTLKDVYGIAYRLYTESLQVA